MDDKNSDEKFDRIVAAARRQAQRSWLMTMETEELRSVVRNIIETNKPAQTDRSDMVLHNDEALDLMRELGVNSDQLRRAGVDGYTLFLQNLAEFAYGNELMEQREALYEELAKTPLGEEGKIASIREGIKTLSGLIDESRVVNKNMGSLSGRILQGMKMMNRQQLRQAIRTQERIRGDREQIVNNIEELRKQQEITRQKLHNLQKSFAALMEVVNKRLNTNPNVRHKEFGDMSDIERQREMLAMEAEERALQAELDNFDAQIQGEINRLKVTNEREAEISKEIDTLKSKKKGKKIRITNVKPRTPNAEDIIKAVFYNSILSSPSTHAVNIVSTASNVFIEGLINDLTTRGSANIDIRKTIKEALKEMGNELVDKGKDPQKYAEAQSRALQAGNRYGNPKDRAKFWLWWALNLNMRLMSVEDTFFYVLTRERQLANLAYAKAAAETKNRAERNRRAELYYAKPDTDMVIQAEYEAKHATFNKMPEGTLGRMVTGMSKLYTDLSESHGLVGKMGAVAMRMTIMPFTKVVGNVANTWMNYIPILGHIQAYKYKQIGKGGQLDPNTMMNRQRNIWKNEDGTLRVSPYRMRDFHRQMMRAHIGTALTALMALFAWGLLTKDDDDPEEEYYELKKMAGYISGAGPKNYNLTKDMNAAFGYQTNSVRVVGTDIWLPWSDWPVAGVFAVIGTLHDYTTWRKPERPVNFVGAMTTIMMGVAKQFLDKQFLSNMAESMDAVRAGDQKWMQRTSMNILTNPVNPNALRFFRKCFDGQAYGAETIEEQLRLSLWFGKREGYLPEKLNVAGKPERQAAPYYRFFSIAKPDEYFDYVDENGTAHNLRNMVMKFAAKGVAVSRVRGYEIAIPQGGNIWLTGKDQEDFAKLRTGLLNALLITNEGELLKLADGSDTKKLQNKLRGLASKATKEAKKTMLEDFNATTMKFRTDGHSYKDDVYSIPKEEEE
ncbi:MAG: hypothetical protein PHW93_06855 [Candidatus Methanomethylophilaceae archaeon]|nr:hypothetical protein [Candidatus Methanomethylophilaceae archaeon]